MRLMLNINMYKIYKKIRPAIKILVMAVIATTTAVRFPIEFFRHACLKGRIYQLSTYLGIMIASYFFPIFRIIALTLAGGLFVWLVMYLIHDMLKLKGGNNSGQRNPIGRLSLSEAEKKYDELMEICRIDKIDKDLYSVRIINEQYNNYQTLGIRK